MLKGRSVASGVPPQSLVMVCYGRLTVWFCRPPKQMSDPPHIFSSWTLPFRPKPCAIACLYQRCPATSFPRDGGQRGVIFATVPPPAAQKIAAARLLDDGGVLSWTLDVPAAAPTPGDQAACHVADLGAENKAAKRKSKRRLATIAPQ